MPILTIVCAVIMLVIGTVFNIAGFYAATVMWGFTPVVIATLGAIAVTILCSLVLINKETW